MAGAFVAAKVPASVRAAEVVFTANTSPVPAMVKTVPCTQERAGSAVTARVVAAGAFRPARVVKFAGLSTVVPGVREVTSTLTVHEAAPAASEPVKVSEVDPAVFPVAVGVPVQVVV
ncbi:hypothetical protein GCM10009593_29490 [Microlunatus antarcticus]